MENKTDEEKNANSVNASTVSASTSKKQEKGRKKDPKSWENVSKIISNLDDSTKVTRLGEKYIVLYNEYWQLNNSYQAIQAQLGVIKAENAHSRAELTKSFMARARLESLCRELQKQNKLIKEENMAKIKEEEERRKEVSLKFADKLTDINNMVDENKEKSEKLREENLKMTGKLAEISGQFKKREDDLAKMSHQMELERQYSQATIAKMELTMKVEKESYAKGYAEIKNDLEKSEANCRVLLETIKGLQSHIDIYKDQYQDFEKTMTKSNKIFDNFKVEMASMNEQMSTLEKEAQNWKNKWQESTLTILEITESRTHQAAKLQIYERKIENLLKLCRQLQTERALFLKLLKENGIEPTVDMDKNESIKKMTKKEQELVLLKNSLKLVQKELVRVQLTDTESEAQDTLVENAQTSQDKLHPEILQPNDSNTPEESNPTVDSPIVADQQKE